MTREPRLTSRGEFLRGIALLSLPLFWLPWLAAAIGYLLTGVKG